MQVTVLQLASANLILIIAKRSQLLRQTWAATYRPATSDALAHGI
jgi:hypothetical protein